MPDENSPDPEDNLEEPKSIEEEPAYVAGEVTIEILREREEEKNREEAEQWERDHPKGPF